MRGEGGFEIFLLSENLRSGIYLRYENCIFLFIEIWDCDFLFLEISYSCAILCFEIWDQETHGDNIYFHIYSLRWWDFNFYSLRWWDCVVADGCTQLFTLFVPVSAYINCNLCKWHCTHFCAGTRYDHHVNYTIQLLGIFHYPSGHSISNVYQSCSQTGMRWYSYLKMRLI